MKVKTHRRQDPRRTPRSRIQTARIVIPDTAKENLRKARSSRRRRPLDNGKRVPFHSPEGDRVLFASYAGTECKVEGRDYLIMAEEDILAILTK